MPRVNLSIPSEIKERMDIHQEINWSKTAAEAFTNKINEIELFSEVHDMTDAIARLKASKANFELKEEENGYKSSLEWAMKRASWEELNRLSDYYDNPLAEALTTTSEFNYVITNKGEYFGDAFEYEEGTMSEAFVSGFTKGALEVFEKAEA